MDGRGLSPSRPTGIATIAYPISLYTNAETSDNQISALLILVGTGLVLAVVDAVSALMAYS